MSAKYLPITGSWRMALDELIQSLTLSERDMCEYVCLYTRYLGLPKDSNSKDVQ